MTIRPRKGHNHSVSGKIFGALMKPLPDIEFAAEPRRLRSNFVNGVKEMQVSFTPTATIHSD